PLVATGGASVADPRHLQPQARRSALHLVLRPRCRPIGDALLPSQALAGVLELPQDGASPSPAASAVAHRARQLLTAPASRGHPLGQAPQRPPGVHADLCLVAQPHRAALRRPSLLPPEQLGLPGPRRNPPRDQRLRRLAQPATRQRQAPEARETQADFRFTALAPSMYFGEHAIRSFAQALSTTT